MSGAARSQWNDHCHGPNGQSAASPGSERTASITAGAIIMINADEAACHFGSASGRVDLSTSDRELHADERGNDDDRGGNAEPVAN